MSGSIVVKVGGSTLADGEAGLDGVASLVRAGERVVVVHGGGPEATAWLEAMGIPTGFQRGRRVTDDRALPVVVAVFAGLVNKRLVAALADRGVEAVGLSGADGGLLRCRWGDPSLGFVGEPASVDGRLLARLVDAGFTPVLAPIGFVDADGRRVLLNVNADSVASEVAVGLRARAVYFLTDVEGVRGRDGTLVRRLTATEARALIADGTIAGGMIPKVEACLRAAERGVPARVLHARDARSLAGADLPGTVVEPGR